MATAMGTARKKHARCSQPRSNGLASVLTARGYGGESRRGGRVADLLNDNGPSVFDCVESSEPVRKTSARPDAIPTANGAAAIPVAPQPDGLHGWPTAQQGDIGTSCTADPAGDPAASTNATRPSRYRLVVDCWMRRVMGPPSRASASAGRVARTASHIQQPSRRFEQLVRAALVRGPTPGQEAIRSCHATGEGCRRSISLT